jgi:hypothetical protein
MTAWNIRGRSTRGGVRAIVGIAAQQCRGELTRVGGLYLLKRFFSDLNCQVIRCRDEPG